MAKAIIGIGIPGSGKSTVLSRLSEETGAIYVSTDQIRQELTGSEADQSRNKQVIELMYQRAHEALDAGEDVIIDATNAKKPDRLRLIAHCRMKADEVIGIWLVTPNAVSFQRNRARVRVVRDSALQSMARSLRENPPSLDEGFDELLRVDASK